MDGNQQLWAIFWIGLFTFWSIRAWVERNNNKED